MWFGVKSFLHVETTLEAKLRSRLCSCSPVRCSGFWLEGQNAELCNRRRCLQQKRGSNLASARGRPTIFWSSDDMQDTLQLNSMDATISESQGTIIQLIQVHDTIFIAIFKKGWIKTRKRSAVNFECNKYEQKKVPVCIRYSPVVCAYFFLSVRHLLPFRMSWHG